MTNRFFSTCVSACVKGPDRDEANPAPFYCSSRGRQRVTGRGGGAKAKTAGEVIFFSLHLFLQIDKKRDAAAAFNALLPLPELFGSAPLTLPPTPSSASCSATVKITAWNHGPLVLDSPVASHRALPAISQKLLPAALSGIFFLFWGVWINKWKVPPPSLPSGRAELLWVSSGLLCSSLDFLEPRWGVQSGGGRRHISQSNHIFPAYLYRRSKPSIHELIDLFYNFWKTGTRETIHLVFRETIFYRLLQQFGNTLLASSRGLTFKSQQGVVDENSSPLHFLSYPITKYRWMVPDFPSHIRLETGLSEAFLVST